MKKTAVIFPGQGSQFVGMGKDFLDTDPDETRPGNKWISFGKALHGWPDRRSDQGPPPAAGNDCYQFNLLAGIK